MAIKIDVGRLGDLLKCFYTVTGMRIVIFDDAFREVLAYPEQPCPLCRLIKAAPDARSGCADSDRQACLTCLSTGEMHIYRCHAGLVEACAPIKVNNVVMGYIMFGQIRDRRGREQTRKNVAERCAKYRLDGREMTRAADQLIYKTDAQIHAAARIMESCACSLWVNELITIAQENLPYRLENYINRHIAEDLSVGRLCEALLTSRSSLYEAARSRFHMGLARYIRKKRVLHAEKLLKSGLMVKEAGALAGFGDYNYFGKVFKSETGLSPREYKNALNRRDERINEK